MFTRVLSRWVHWAVSQRWLVTWDHNQADIPHLHYHSVVFPNAGGLFEHSKQVGCYPGTHWLYCLQDSFCALRHGQFSTWHQKVIISGICISLKFRYWTLQTTNAHKSPNISLMSEPKSPGMPTLHCRYPSHPSLTLVLPIIAIEILPKSFQ